MWRSRLWKACSCQGTRPQSTAWVTESTRTMSRSRAPSRTSHCRTPVRVTVHAADGSVVGVLRCPNHDHKGRRSMKRHHRTAAALVTVSLAGIVGACSSSTPTVTADDFAAGPCQQVAPAVLQIGHLVSVANKHHGVSKQNQKAFATAQTQLRGLASKPPGSDALITAIGFLRLRLDSHSYQSQQLADVQAAQLSVQRTCTQHMAQ